MCGKGTYQGDGFSKILFLFLFLILDSKNNRSRSIGNLKQQKKH